MLRVGAVAGLAAVPGGEVYHVALLVGVLMYLPASRPALAELAHLILRRTDAATRRAIDGSPRPARKSMASIRNGINQELP